MREVTATEAAVDPSAVDLDNQPVNHDHYDEVVSGEETIVRDQEGEIVAHLLPDALSQEVRNQTLETVNEHYMLQHPNAPSPGYYEYRWVYGYHAFNDPQMPERALEYGPVAEELEAHFHEHYPEKAERQAELGHQEYDDGWIGESNFNRVTINYNYATNTHRDGVGEPSYWCPMAVIADGDVQGGLLVLPEVGVGIDLTDRDVLLYNVYPYHGVTNLESGQRISVVPYWMPSAPFDQLDDGSEE